jgi:uncharacterized membrane protein YoaK (UPF0700 family)
MPGRRQDALVALLAMTAGATDAISFLALGGVFSSVMTANMVLLGLSAGKHSGPLALHAGAALAGYIVGAVAASRVTASARVSPSAGRRPAAVFAVLLAEGIVLACAAVGWEIAGAHPSGAAQVALLAGAAAAMGGQSAAVRALAIPGISTTYMTGMLTGILADLATPAGRPVGSRLRLLATLIAGAIAGGIAYAQAPRLAPLIPLVPLAWAIGLAASTRPGMVGPQGDPGPRRSSGPALGRPSAHSQAGQEQGADHHNDADDQQVEQAFHDDAGDAQPNGHDH